VPRPQMPNNALATQKPGGNAPAGATAGWLQAAVGTRRWTRLKQGLG
jgi:hypothetical protein